MSGKFPKVGEKRLNSASQNYTIVVFSRANGEVEDTDMGGKMTDTRILLGEDNSDQKKNRNFGAKFNQK